MMRENTGWPNEGRERMERFLDDGEDERELIR